MLQDSAAAAAPSGGGSPVTPTGSQPQEDNVRPGSRWEAVGARKDGRRRVVTLIARVGPLKVEIEDIESGRRKAIQTASLLTNYTYLGAGEPPAHTQPARNATGTPTQLGAEVERLRRALAEAAVPGTRITTIQWPVTPALAEALLANNPSNRAPSLDVVTQYARDLTQGNWPVSHQGIALGPEMELGDGAHRCLAIIKSGVTPTLLVTRYHERADYEIARRTWDSGRRRSKANVLELSGLVPKGRGRHTAAVLEAVTYVDGRYPGHPTNDDLVAMYNEFRTSVEAVAKLNPAEFMAPTRAAFVIAHRKAPKEVEECIRLVAEKVGYQEGSAAHSLVLKIPELQKTKARKDRDRTGLMKDVLSLLYKHVRGEPGVTVVKQNSAAYAFFLGSHFRETSGR
jgi:hypothetical protein